MRNINSEKAKTKIPTQWGGPKNTVGRNTFIFCDANRELKIRIYLEIVFSYLTSNFIPALSVNMLPTHAPSPCMQSSANGQSFPFPDFAIVSVKTLSKPFSHAAEHKENVPSQSTSAAQTHLCVR